MAACVIARVQAHISLRRFAHPRMSFADQKNLLRRLHDEAQLMKMTFTPDGTLLYSHYDAEKETYTFIVNHRNQIFTIERDPHFFASPRILCDNKAILGSDYGVNWDPSLTTLAWFIQVTLAMDDATTKTIKTEAPTEIVVS
jgi:hypothetical protein